MRRTATAYQNTIQSTSQAPVGSKAPGQQARERAVSGDTSLPVQVLTWLAPLFALIVMAALLASCAPTTLKHGHHFRASDLAQVQEGMTKEQVTGILGTPDTTSPIGTGLGYYYISSVEKQNSFFKPDEVDRKVVAVYFNQLESVERIAHYGMRDGKVFDFIDRKTATHARDESILKALFRNLGKTQGIL